MPILIRNIVGRLVWGAVLVHALFFVGTGGWCFYLSLGRSFYLGVVSMLVTLAASCLAVMWWREGVVAQLYICRKENGSLALWAYDKFSARKVPLGDCIETLTAARYLGERVAIKLVEEKAGHWLPARLNFSGSSMVGWTVE